MKKATRKQQIEALMRIRFDLDQLALARLQAELDAQDRAIEQSHSNSAKFAASAFEPQQSPALTDKNLQAQEALRTKIEHEKARLEAQKAAQKERLRVSFAKWRVAQKLTSRR